MVGAKGRIIRPLSGPRRLSFSVSSTFGCHLCRAMECAASDSTSHPRRLLCPDNEPRPRYMWMNPCQPLRLQARITLRDHQIAARIPLSFSPPSFVLSLSLSLSLVSFDRVKGPRGYGHRFESDERFAFWTVLWCVVLVNIYISSSKVINNRGEMNYRSTRGFERFELLILVILKEILSETVASEERSFHFGHSRIGR